MAASNRSVDASPKPFHGPWEGQSKIVIGVDVGTTQSGVAFAFLHHGENQTLHRVVHWPQSQQSKIPTLVWYNSNKQAVSFGAEALSYQAEESAEDCGWQLAKHFKLHLHPSDLRSRHGLKLDPLPVGVPLQQVYSDFLGYLLQHTKSFFEDRILDGKTIWTRYQPTMEVVIAHPNGWGIREQIFLRNAAVKAGFADTASALTKIKFVTEAEASVHFCLYHTNLSSRLKPGVNFAVCDAGGSTVDTTVYSVASARPALKLEEKRASGCVQAGGIFVDAMAERHLRATFTNAALLPEEIEECTKGGVKDFETFSKRLFHDTTADQVIKIGNSHLNKPAIKTRRGRMTLSGSTIESFFDLCSQEIKTSVDQQVDGLPVAYILLVGGFGDSPYLRQEFKNRYESQGSQIALTNDSTSKAVADGAVIWNTISSVISRFPHFSFGALYAHTFRPWSDEHADRITYNSPDGRTMVPGAWSQIVSKHVALDAEAVQRESFCRLYESATPNLRVFSVELFKYSGDDEPTWAWNKRGTLLPNFRGVCTITADLKNLSGALEEDTGIHGETFWSLSFTVCIRFGGTELEAYLEWEENGVTRTGPVTIIPESVV